MNIKIEERVSMPLSSLVRKRHQQPVSGNAPLLCLLATSFPTDGFRHMSLSSWKNMAGLPQTMLGEWGASTFQYPARTSPLFRKFTEGDSVRPMRRNNSDRSHCHKSFLVLVRYLDSAREDGCVGSTPQSHQACIMAQMETSETQKKHKNKPPFPR